MRCLTVAVACVLVAATANAEEFRVSRAADDRSDGSLRWAIEQANGHPGPDTITFSASDVRLFSALPVITDSLTIVGQGQTFIDGAEAGSASGIVAGAQVAIRGLRIGNFRGNGIELYGEGSLVEACAVGWKQFSRDCDCGVAAPNTGDGVVVGGARTSITSSVISNSKNGVRVTAAEVRIAGNYIGMPSAALPGSGNRENGVWIEGDAQGAHVGGENDCTGACAGEPGNVINGNGANGVLVDGRSNFIIGNTVGNCRGCTTPHAGRFANGANGILVRGAANVVYGNVTSTNHGYGLSVVSGTRSWFNEGGCNDRILVEVHSPGDHPLLPDPVKIIYVLADAGASEVRFEAHGAPNTAYLLDIYGYENCEHNSLLASIPFETDSSGYAFLTRTVSAALPHMVATLVRLRPADGTISPVVSDYQRYNGVWTRSSDSADIELRATSEPAAAPGVVTVRMEVKNNGPAVVPAVTIHTPVVSNVSVMNTPAGCVRSDFALDCTTAPLSGGQSQTFVFDIGAVGSGPWAIRPTAKVQSTPGAVAYSDPRSDNNEVSVDLRPNGVRPKRRAAAH